MPDDVTPEVRDNPAERRFEIWLGQDLAGLLFYDEGADGLLLLLHTEIHPRFEGHGLGSRLIGSALDTVRERGRQILPSCPFVQAYLRKYPDYVNLVPLRRRPGFDLPDPDTPLVP